MFTLAKRALIIVLLLFTVVYLTAPLSAQRTSHRHHRRHRDSHTARSTKVAKKRIVPQNVTIPVFPEQPPSPPNDYFEYKAIGVVLLITLGFFSTMVWVDNRQQSQRARREDAHTMSQKLLSSSHSAEGSSTPRASGVSADLQQIALEYTQVTGKGLFGGHSELLRQNSQGALEAKGVDAAIRRLDNRDRIVNRLAQSIRAEDGLKETTHQYELNEILREQKHKAVRAGSTGTPSLPSAAAPASLPSAPVQPYASPDRLEGLALHGVLIYRTEGQQSFARFASALSNDLGRNEVEVVTRRMDEMLAKLDCV